MRQREQYFRQSAQRAKNAGFIHYDSKDTFDPAYERDGLKWIHSLPLLMDSLDIYDENFLEKLGYDVTAYFLYNFEAEIIWYRNKEAKEYPLLFPSPFKYEIPDKIMFSPIVND